MTYILVALVLLASIQPLSPAPSSDVLDEPDEPTSFVRSKKSLTLEQIATWARQRTPILLYNPTYNEFVFVSNDKFNGDNVVETHSDPSETRNQFQLIPCSNGYMLYSPSYNKYLFLSNDKRGSPPDNVLEAHSNANDNRNCFTFHVTGDNYIQMYSPNYGRTLFVSNDIENGDNIVEGHANNENRNNFVPVPYLGG